MKLKYIEVFDNVNTGFDGPKVLNSIISDSGLTINKTNTDNLGCSYKETVKENMKLKQHVEFLEAKLAEKKKDCKNKDKLLAEKKKEIKKLNSYLSKK